MAKTARPLAPAHKSGATAPGSVPDMSQSLPGLSVGQWAQFLAGVRVEWRKITWPSVPQLWTQTLVVLTMVTLTTLSLWGVDNLFRVLLGWLTPHR